MDEVDGIILHNLKLVGCDIDDSVLSLKEFTTDLIVEATVSCLRLIADRADLPLSLPPGMSARFRIGTSLATGLKDIGYRGEIGYQTFLYSNEADIRRVFMFLIEKLPKESAEILPESLGTSALVNRAISAEINRLLTQTWMPAFCKKSGLRWRTEGKGEAYSREGVKGTHSFSGRPLSVVTGTSDLTKPLPKELKRYFTHHCVPVTRQPIRRNEVMTSLLQLNADRLTAALEWESEWNQFGLASRLSQKEYLSRKKLKVGKRISEQLRQSAQGVRDVDSARFKMADIDRLLNDVRESRPNSGSRFARDKKLRFDEEECMSASATSEEEAKAQRLEELSGMKVKLSELVTDVEEFDSQIKNYKAGIQQMEEVLIGLTLTNNEKENSHRLKKKTLDLLPDSDSNLSKLQELADTTSQKLVNLANQWEKHRAPLIDKYRKLKDINETMMESSEHKLEEIQGFREKVKTLSDEAKEKDELTKQLRAEFDRTPKDVNRSIYTKRIIEIVDKIKKQKDDINKILADTRAVQKEINNLTGKLDRTFTVTDELIFKDAKKDESVKKAYKFLAALHENCGLLIKTVEGTGSTMREIRDLEDQIDQEKCKNTVTNLEKMLRDYQQMKLENESLDAKLQSLKSS